MYLLALLAAWMTLMGHSLMRQREMYNEAYACFMIATALAGIAAIPIYVHSLVILHPPEWTSFTWLYLVLPCVAGWYWNLTTAMRTNPDLRRRVWRY